LARRANSPWSKTYKEGLPTTAVDDHVNINQTVAGTITTGVIDSATGQWQGITVSDSAFTLDPIQEAIANGATVTAPQADPIDMTGFNDLLIALLPTQGGNHAIEAVMSGAVYYANLTPPNGGSSLRGNQIGTSSLSDLLFDSADSLTADVWNIFMIKDQMRGQKSFQFKITNNSGSEENLTFAYLRVV